MDLDVARLARKLTAVIQRIVVEGRSSASRWYQVSHAAGVSADVEHMEPQGLHFSVPRDAGGLMLAPGAVRAATVVIDAQGSVPGDLIEAGEGGLHYLGTWSVFLARDGTVHVGGREPGDFAALASRVDAEISGLKDDIKALRDNVKSALASNAIPSGPATGAVNAAGAAGAISYTPANPQTVASEKVRIG